LSVTLLRQKDKCQIGGDVPGRLVRLRRENPTVEQCPSLTRRSWDHTGKEDLRAALGCTRRSLMPLMAWRLLEGVVHPKGRCSREDVGAGLTIRSSNV